MATTIAVAYNPTLEVISQTTQYGDLRVGVQGGVTSVLNYAAEPGGIRWWMTPDLDPGYVVALPVPSGDQPNDAGGLAYVGFYRTEAKTEEDYVYLTNYVLGAAPNFTVADASGANNYILFNLLGWSSYPTFG